MDPALRELLRSEEAVEDRTIEAIIRLRRPGVTVPDVRLVSLFGTIATCRVPASSVGEVRAHPNALSLKAARRLVPDLEPVTPDGAVESRSGLRPTDSRRSWDLPLSGAGVVVGVVDWGIDFDHPAFRRPDGSTRLLALWDQRPHRSGDRPAPYGYGRVHGPRRINAALRSRQPYRELGYHPAAADRGTGSHGTHVVDIAAGNGRGGGPAGVAPDADLVFVHLADRDTGGRANLGDSVRLLEAVDFIARTAGQRPWVINISVGRHGGPHDGTTLTELAFDELLDAAPGRFIVQSTGNYFRSRTHACGVLRSGQAESLRFVTSAADTSTNELEIWYDGSDEFVIRIAPPGAIGTTAVRLGNQTELIVNRQVVGRAYHRARDPNNLDNHFDAFLYPSAPAGTWTVTIEAARAGTGRYHAWLERDEACKQCQTRFTVSDANPTFTTGTIANGHLPLVVGAYDAHTRCWPVASFSSTGPTRDARLKPDVAAPGVDVLAARSAPAGSTRSPGLLVRKSGTSMATPHATGAVALCLQAAGHRLGARQIRALLLNNADPPATTDPGHRLGRGYLDIPDLVAAVRRRFPDPVTRTRTKAAAMDADLEPDPEPLGTLAFAPAQAYRELLYRPDSPLSRWIGTRFDIAARPGQRVVGAPLPGDVLLTLDPDRPDAGRCLELRPANLTRERILTSARRMPGGQLLLRPRTVDGTADSSWAAESDGETASPGPRIRMDAELRAAWRGYECAEKRMVPLRLFGKWTTPVNPATVDAWRALEHALVTAGYPVHRAWVYICRKITGKQTPSLHAYGLAIDIDHKDPTCNVHRGTPDGRRVRFSAAASKENRCRDVRDDKADTSFTPNQVAAVEAIRTVDGHQVFAWGGRWQMSKDTMHFQINVTPQELARGLRPAGTGTTPTLPTPCAQTLKGLSVAVVGGGLAGLLAARTLCQQGVTVTVFEGREQVGGRVLSDRSFSRGRITEFGAELVGSIHTRWGELATEYGLALISRMDTDLYRGQGLNVKLTLDRPLTMDEIRALGAEQETRVLRPIAKLASTIVDASRPWLFSRLRLYDNMSVAAALTNLFGVKRTERLWLLMEMLLVNNNVARLDELNFLGLLCLVKGGQAGTVGDSLMGYWDELEIYRCADGCQQLAVAMAADIQTRHGCKVMLRRAVTHIDLANGVTVASRIVRRDGTLEDGSPHLSRFDYVILAVPPTVWADIKITPVHPKEPSQVGLMGTGDAVKFLSDVKGRFWVKGKSAPYGGSLTLGQVWEGTDSQTRIGDQGVVLSVFAGARTPTANQFKQGLTELYPSYPQQLIKSKLVNWPSEPFIKTGYATPKLGQIFTVGKRLSEPFQDRMLFAGEHTQMNHFGYMEGALRSGERAAHLLMQRACGLPAPADPALVASAAP